MTRNFRYLISLTFIFFLILIPLLPVLFSEEEQPEEASGEFRAVLIGIDDYKSWPGDKEYANLNYSVKDIEAIADILKKNGYKDENITVVKEVKADGESFPATKSRIEGKIKEVIARCNKNDVILVYFSGHGIRLEDGEGRIQNYLVPYDGKYIPGKGSVEELTREELTSRKETLLTVSSIDDLLKNNCHARTKYFIMDACQKDVLANVERGEAKVKSDFHLDPTDIKKGLIKITSCSAGETSRENPEKGHGLFSYALIEGINDKADKDQNGQITITELFDYVSKQVPEYAREMKSEQTPLLLMEEVEGEIVFAYNPAKMEANALKQESQKLLSESRKETLSEKEKESKLQTALEKLAEAKKIWSGGEYSYLQKEIQNELAGLTGIIADEAWKLLQSEDYEKALEKIEKAIKLDKNNWQYSLLKEKIITAMNPPAGTKKTIKIKGIEYTFCWCPAGTFEMGSPESEKDRRDDETQHTVTLSNGFWMLEHEVTLEMFRSFMASTSYKMGNGYEGIGGYGYNTEKDKFEQDPKYTWENPGFSQDDDHPVTNVDWAGAKAFCKWLSQESGEKIDLPSEAEWEYACRAGTTSPFNFGEVLNGKQANCNGNSPYGTDEKGPYLKKTTRVKSYSPNAWGLYDMHGNVWEWCNDLYDSYTKSPSTDPKGPDSGSSRVCRGGSWVDLAWRCRSAYRGGDAPGNRGDILGFRLALLPPVSSQKLTGEAWQLYEAGDYEKALSKINEALEQDSENISHKATKELIETVAIIEMFVTAMNPPAGTKKTIKIKGIEYTFRWCPAGTFEMGSPESEKDREDDETQHTVTLSNGFWMLEHEVTLEMFRSFMASTSYKMGDGYKGQGGYGYNAEKDKYEQDSKYTWENPGFSQDDDHPVTNVDWAGAKAFCKWLSQESGEEIDLPSEAEWEYACRAGTTTPFNFGGVLNGDKANCNGNSPYGTDEKGLYLKKTTRVKSYSPNAWGLYDMHGNVWEWCNDWYDSDYYTKSSKTDPTGSDSGSRRINRGGSWYSSAQFCRSADRDWNDPSYRDFYLGFRLALRSSAGR